MDLMYNNHDDVSNVHLSSSTEGADGLSETLNSTLGFRQRQRQQQQREHERLRANRIVTALSTETASDGEEPVTDDGDEDYEDVEEEEEEEMSEDEDFEHPWQRYYDEPDYSEDEDEHLHPWRRYYRRAVEEEQQTRRRPVPINQMDDYDIDRFNDEVYDYNSRMARDELRHDLEEVDDNYHHHRLHLHHHHAHSHFHQNGVPMIEHVISMLYGVAPDRDGSEHPLSSILNDLLQNQDGSVQRVAASSEEIEKLEKRELKEGDPGQ
ncbi:hypothetical protein BDB00DRAFT_236301 [Zychaea mexicana]|uniref:uncharacterized protein n=1 Tax=Zychaea mexicana TaxID=64656 RepID=UPI0022FE87FC|nr:uncharacterized protein BDB00DRAFT_236301 [Zychaea mexicana]KAI9495513.1 hypothetical protein BDB00DRAFT_236301 [Zychaea mexicana]